MVPNDIKKLLRAVAAGRLDVPRAIERLRGLPFEDLGFARVDQHRHLRRGLPEIVFGQGKTAEQCARIVDRIASAGHVALVTRATQEQHKAVGRLQPKAQWHPVARMITLKPGRRPSPPTRDRGAQKKVTEEVIVVTAGTSDLPVAEEGALTAETLGLSVGRLYDVGVAGIHRLVDERTRMESASVLIVVAGMEGALPSVVAGLVSTPVIGVPTSVGYGAALGGLTALFGMLTSCAGGLTVVNIDNGFGAAYSAALMIRRMKGGAAHRSSKARAPGRRGTRPGSAGRARRPRMTGSSR